MSRVFEAMESFVASCENAYKDLNRRAEEERELRLKTLLLVQRETRNLG